MSAQFKVTWPTGEKHSNGTIAIEGLRYGGVYFHSQDGGCAFYAPLNREEFAALKRAIQEAEYGEAREVADAVHGSHETSQQIGGAE